MWFDIRMFVCVFIIYVPLPWLFRIFLSSSSSFCNVSYQLITVRVFFSPESIGRDAWWTQEANMAHIYHKDRMDDFVLSRWLHSCWEKYELEECCFDMYVEWIIIITLRWFHLRFYLSLCLRVRYQYCLYFTATFNLLVPTVHSDMFAFNV